MRKENAVDIQTSLFVSLVLRSDYFKKTEQRQVLKWDSHSYIYDNIYSQGEEESERDKDMKESTDNGGRDHEKGLTLERSKALPLSETE